MDTGDDIPIPYGNENGQRRVMIERISRLVPGTMFLTPPFPYLQGRSLLPFSSEGIVARIAAVPAKFFGSLDGQVKGIVVTAIHQDDLRAVDKQLGHFGRRG